MASNKPGNNDHDDDQQQPPYHRQDNGYVDFGEGLTKQQDVKNSLPPPRNPNRNDSGEDDD